MLKKSPSRGEPLIHIWTYRAGKVIIPEIKLQGKKYSLIKFLNGEPEAISWQDLVQNENRKCWRCHHNVNIRKSLICETCHWFICPNCGACEETGNHLAKPIPKTGKTDV